jgi:CheY-like chemotaxis protein
MTERSVFPGDDADRKLPSVLIVDDELKIRSAVRQALEREVDAVLEASNGRDAIAIAERERPGSIIIDLGLPDMEGIEVCRAIRGWSSAPILVLSARTDEQEKASLLEAGAFVAHRWRRCSGQTHRSSSAISSSTPHDAW